MAANNKKECILFGVLLDLGHRWAVYEKRRFLFEECKHWSFAGFCSSITYIGYFVLCLIQCDMYSHTVWHIVNIHSNSWFLCTKTYWMSNALSDFSKGKQSVIVVKIWDFVVLRNWIWNPTLSMLALWF